MALVVQAPGHRRHIAPHPYLGDKRLYNAYLLRNPQEFVMIFFSASFMILLGITGLIYPAYRIHAYFKNDSFEKYPEV